MTTKTLRYYENERLLHEPDRTSSGYRDYSPDVIDRVTFIRQVQAAGLTLNQIAEILQIRDVAAPHAATSPDWFDNRLAVVEQHLAELQRTRTQLRQTTSPPRRPRPGRLPARRHLRGRHPAVTPAVPGTDTPGHAPTRMGENHSLGNYARFRRWTVT